MILQYVSDFEVDREEVERAEVGRQHDPELMTNTVCCQGHLSRSSSKKKTIPN